MWGQLVVERDLDVGQGITGLKRVQFPLPHHF